MGALDELMRSVKSSLVLPSHRFFTPTDAFWPALKEAVPPGVTLVDTGCGCGDLIGEAAKHGITLIGIDIARRDTQDPRVQIRDALQFPWQHNVWPMFCRPSHDGWMTDTMTLARQVGAHAIYVGLLDNYEQDCGSRESKSFGVVGQEEERMYLFQPFKGSGCK